MALSLLWPEDKLIDSIMSKFGLGECFHLTCHPHIPRYRRFGKKLRGCIEMLNSFAKNECDDCIFFNTWNHLLQKKLLPVFCHRHKSTAQYDFTA